MAPPRVPDRAAAGGGTRRPWWLIAVGVGAALLIALATLPASLFADRLASAGLGAASFSGSIWSGEARSLAWRTGVLGDLSWSFAPLDLLRGRLGVQLSLARADGRFATHASVSPGGRVTLADTQMDLPLAALAALPVGLPANWQGRVRGTFEEVVLDKGAPTALRGKLDLDDLVAPPPRNLPIGSYAVQAPDPAAAAGPAGEISLAIKDKGGPFAFDGRLTISGGRSYLLEGLVATRGNVPEQVSRALQMLGPADASGRRQLSLSGTF
jgi:general secretion pathway protein N